MTLGPGQSYLAYIGASNAMLVSGAGGFGANGTTSHNIGLLYTITTASLVTDWRMVKAKGYIQVADNTAPLAPNSYSVCFFMGTLNPGDATSIVITGGGIAGGMPFTQEGNQWFLETDFSDEASMDATFPSSAVYTVTLSGGALGTLVQLVSLAAPNYPNVPYLTVTTLTDLQTFDATIPNTLTWSDPGPLTQGSGVTVLSMYDLVTDDTLYQNIVIGAPTAGTYPAHTTTGLEAYSGFLEYTHAQTVSGIGGFGVNGTTGHNTALDFSIVATDDGCQTDLGFQGPGTAYLKVCGEGLDTGDISEYSLSFSAPFANVFVLLSFPGGGNLMAKGGTLVSVTGLIAGFPLVLPTDEFGELSFPVAGGFGPFTVISQCVVADASQSFNFQISNAVSLAFGP